MYRIMIVDDEMLARIGIKSIIPWQEHGFELVGEFENGQKALEMAKVLQPDIIITDVRMPVLNGIELIKGLKKEGLDAKYLILSSYDDFEFVREGMKLGAEDYLLKLDMEPEKLLSILSKIVDKIKAERNQRDESKRLEKHYHANLQVLREKFVRDWLAGKFPDKADIDEGLAFYQVNLPERNLVCIAVTANTRQVFEGYLENDMDFLKLSVVNILQDTVSSFGTALACSIKEFLYVVVASLEGNAEISWQTIIGRMIRNITGLLKDTLNLTAWVGVSSLCSDYSELAAAYSELVGEIDKHRFSEESVNPFSRPDTTGVSIPLEDELVALEAAFRILDAKCIEGVFQRIIMKITGGKDASRKFLNGICHTLIFIVNTFAQTNGTLSANLWGEGVDPYGQIERLHLIQDYVQWIGNLKDRVMQVLNADNDTRTIIVKAKQYIRKHYRQEISLEATAEQLGLSANYFSRLFSRETGQSFIDYLIEVRIQEAKELLKKSNSKIYEVSELVGYDNPHYFSRLFKKVTGFTPLEFKEKGNGVK